MGLEHGKKKQQWTVLRGAGIIRETSSESDWVHFMTLSQIQCLIIA